jgi:hypothetical protein
VQEDANEEARVPYEQLGRRQNEIQFGASNVLRDRSAGLDVRTQSTLAFIGLSRGFTTRLELGVLLPYVLYSEQTAVRDNGDIVRTGGHYGVSDPTLRVRYALKPEDRSLAVTLGLLATPDWGGRARSFNAPADRVEPFVVLGRSVGAGKAYLRYGYLFRSGDAPEAHRFSVGGRYPLGEKLGVLGHVSYLRSVDSPAVEGRGALGATLGGYANLVNGMQLVGSYGQSGFDSQTSAGRPDEARSRTIAFSLVHRF